MIEGRYNNKWGYDHAGGYSCGESESRSLVSDSIRPWDSPGHNTGVGSLSLLQGVFPTQGVNPGLPQCRRVLYQLSHQGSPTVERGLLIKEDP